MKRKEKRIRFFNLATLRVVGILAVLFLAALLLWHGNVNSHQAEPALVAKVRFEGEYRIGDGAWNKIVEGEHIPATKGDVTLRGNFHMFAPDGSYAGICSGETLIAFYVDHINLTIREEGLEPYVVDHENPMFGVAACGESWVAQTFMCQGTEPLEIVVHNPHRFGNETAIDRMLENVSFWMGIDFEKSVLQSGESQRNVGLLFVIVSLVILGTALFSTLIHAKNSKIIWVFGTVIFFAGTYFAYSSDGVNFWSESIVSNTTILGASIMLYMLFYAIALVHSLKSTKKAGMAVVAALALCDAVLFLVPVCSDVLFYDTWLWWAVAQLLTNIALLVCLVKELFAGKQERWLFMGLSVPLIAFGVDAVMTYLGLWKGGLASQYVFIVFFVVALVAVLKIIPRSINALAKAKELETERIALNAQLTESRVSTMMSQIRPHFIYNTLGSIEQLCSFDPKKAGELVHNFAKYLRGNFGELDNPKPILMSREMEHVHHYVSIENVRFPDMTFSFEMKSGDFLIPALTIQPIVENAIKHGLMKLPRGGTIRVVSYETDTHYCISVKDDGAGFDTGILPDERKHVGIRNIRGRLEAMVNGSLEIESKIGEGTTVLIKIPKEEKK